MPGHSLHSPRLLRQSDLGLTEALGQPGLGYPPELDSLVLGARGKEAVIKWREHEVCDQLGVRVNAGDGGLVGAAGGGEGQHGQAAAQHVPVEGQEGAAGRDEVAAAVVGADGQVPDVGVQLGLQGRRILVFGGFEPPGHAEARRPFVERVGGGSWD